nr:dipeptidase [Hoyosella altamirensis]
MRRAATALVSICALLVGVSASGAAQPPPGVNVEGFAFPDNRVDAPVTGLLQAHDHLWSYKGFGEGPFCGKTFDQEGVAAALADCDTHPLALTAWFEALMEGDEPAPPRGWPTFDDWPGHEWPTHSQSYYKGVERLWRSGVRVFVDHMVSNRALCEVYPLRQSTCDEMASVRAQVAESRAFEAFLDVEYGEGQGWYRIVGSPAEAREVIAQGKMAVVLGVEISEPFGCSMLNSAPQCTEEAIDQGLAELYDLGVRSMFLCHKFDNALCGVRFDEGLTGVAVNAGNALTTGEFWNAETCQGSYQDNTALGFDGLTEAPHCNRRGLTGLGVHTIYAMMERGMIVELDHMSVKAADHALSILEAESYAGVISSHNWMDAALSPRLLQLGGLVTGISRESNQFLDYWRAARAAAPDPDTFAFGYGLDANGLNSGLPRAGQGAEINYPFRSFDGNALIDRQIWGERTWDFNEDGLVHEGLVPDWLEALRLDAGSDGPQFVADMSRGAEAYLRMWEASTER